MAGIIRTLINDIKAWRRGEKRIAARNVRGRVYTRRKPDPDEAAPGQIVASARVKHATIRARIKRADGTIEDLGVIASTEN